MQIDIRNYAEVRDDFVRDAFKQFFCIADAGYMPGIVNADIELAALGIRKTAYPFQIFIVPTQLVFNILACLVAA